MTRRMQSTTAVPIGKENIRREAENDSDLRGTEIVAAGSYPDLVKGWFVDRG